MTLTDADYRDLDDKLLDSDGDTFLVRVVNELNRITAAHPPFTDVEQALTCIVEEFNELRSDLARHQPRGRIRHQLSQIAARCYRMDRDLLTP